MVNGTTTRQQLDVLQAYSKDWDLPESVKDTPFLADHGILVPVTLFAITIEHESYLCRTYQRKV